MKDSETTSLVKRKETILQAIKVQVNYCMQLHVKFYLFVFNLPNPKTDLESSKVRRQKDLEDSLIFFECIQLSIFLQVIFHTYGNIIIFSLFLIFTMSSFREERI